MAGKSLTLSAANSLLCVASWHHSNMAVGALNKIFGLIFVVAFLLAVLFWILWFQLALLILTVLVVIGGRALSIFRPAVLALLAVEVALCTLGTDRALTLRDSVAGDSALSSRAKTLVAGYIITTIVDMILIVCVGAYQTGDAALDGGALPFMQGRSARGGAAAPAKGHTTTGNAPSAPSVPAGSYPNNTPVGTYNAGTVPPVNTHQPQQATGTSVV
eukprot:jgi/Astpho2/366/Aster-02240